MVNFRKIPLFIVCILLLAAETSSVAHISDPFIISASKRFDKAIHSVKSSSLTLTRFLRKMPKGGDLHNHFTGAVYPSNLISYVYGDVNWPWCVYPKTNNYKVRIDCDCKKHHGTILNTLDAGSKVYKNIVRAWSLSGDKIIPPRFGHDQFFSVFVKENALVKDLRYWPEMLADLMIQADKEHISYLELMIQPDNIYYPQSSAVFAKRYLKNLPRPQTAISIKQAMKAVDSHDFINTVVRKGIVEPAKKLIAEARYLLRCNTRKWAKSACRVTVRFQYAVNRTQPLYMVFSGFYAGLLATAIPHSDFVGVNLVAPEDNKHALTDYESQMWMIGLLREIIKPRYGHIPVSLHAGELTKNLVPHEAGGDENLRYHIEEALARADADRIGHGVDLLSEMKMHPLLAKEMSTHNVPIEISLTSNKKILGVCDNAAWCIDPQYKERYNHPFYSYLKKGVPVTLNTDDGGILPTDLSREYYIATTTYSLTYAEIKNIDRNSLSYSFLPGKQLWAKNYHARSKWHYKRLVSACKNDNPYVNKPLSKTCEAFLKKNMKAQLQWQLETDFAKFERHIISPS